jgi:predicted amidohydrolase YtcJ
MNAQSPWAEALAVRNGKIVGVGTTTEITQAYSGTRIHLGGRMLMPSFHDAHLHPVLGGVQTMQCDLSEFLTVSALMQAVAECDANLADDEWLVGGGWNLSMFPEANPSRKLLDAVNPSRPMLLRGADGHSSWTNTKALTLAGIEAETPNPAHGIIEREADGTPSGTLRESAQSLLENVLPVVTAEDRARGLLYAIQYANSMGITSMIDAAVTQSEIEAYESLDEQGKLTARLVLSAAIVGPAPMHSQDDLIVAEDRLTEKRIRRHAAKIFVDGVLEGETAALIEPYIDRNGARGNLLLQPDELNIKVAELDADNVQILFHAIGDHAVRVVLDAIEYARAENGARDNRHHISHLQLIHPDDHARFAELDVAANFQALWAYPEAYITEINLPVVGPERVQRMYPIGSVHRAGGLIVGGSDWSVSSMNPLKAIETALTREDETGSVEGSLNENEKVDLEVMLAAYTSNTAYLMNQEARVGQLLPGMDADLVVLEKDLFSIKPRDIGDVAVLMTLLAGEVVFDSGEIAVTQ